MKYILSLLLALSVAIPAGATIGIWTHQGTLTTLTNSDTPQQPNVIYETGAQILSGTVFKMWYNNGLSNGARGICYAESTDGITWTRYGSNPVLVANAFFHVYKNASTYYLFTGPNVFINANHIDVYTSSDGLAWSLAKANALVTGAAGSWNGEIVMQLNVVTIDAGGTWWGYYAGAPLKANPVWSLGLATSPDGINWTPASNNPIIPQYGPSNATFQYVNGKYYLWSQIVLPGMPGASGQLPSDFARYSSYSPGGPWTVLGTPVPVSTFYRSVLAEGVGLAIGQVADACLVSAAGSLYFFVTQSINGNSGTNYTIGLAKAASTTVAQLVSGYEGLLNIPSPTTAGLGMTIKTLATDNFTRANANPIGGNWTTFSATGGFVAAQLLSNKATSTVAGSNGDSYWNGFTWGADQWAQSTIGTMTATSFVGTGLRMNTSGTQTAYRFYFTGNTGSSGSVVIQRALAAVFLNLKSITFTVSAGDVLTSSVVGTTLSMFLNGNLLWQLTDANIATGASGFGVAPITNVANAGVTNWNGGSLVAGTGTSPIAVSVSSSM